MAEIDWVGRWFTLLEEQGEYAGIRFGSIPPGASEPEWLFLPHSRYDGIGGLSELLRGRGIEPGPMPELIAAGAAGRGKQLRAFARAFAGKPGRHARWRGLTEERAAAIRAHRAGHPGAPPRAVAYHVFSREETDALRRRARDAGVTLNSQLLWALNRAVSPGLDDEGGLSRAWMVPVNLRGGVRLKRPTANHSAFVPAFLAAGGGPAEVHGEVRGQMARGAHWGLWHTMRLGRFIGDGGVRRLRDADQRSGRSWIGAFSNLGAWGPDGATDDGSQWLFCPPVGVAAPLGAGALTWMGRLSLVLQLHPALSWERADAERWLETWKENLDASVARRGAGRAGAGAVSGRDRGSAGLQDQV